MENLMDFLDSIYPLSVGLRNQLTAIIKFKKLPKKALLLKPGIVSRGIYFIHKGLMRAYYEKEGNEVSSWFMKEGDVCVSIESFYDQVESYEFIQAIEDSELFFIDYNELESIYSQFTEFNTIGRVLTIKYLKLWSQQLYGIRMQSAADRYQWLLKEHRELVMRVPQKYIASYLDITPETLSKIRSKNF